MLRTLAAATALVCATAAGLAAAAPTNAPARCYIENGVVHVRNISSGISCVGRSDQASYALVQPGSDRLDFGDPTMAENVFVLFYSDDQCLVQDGFAECVPLARTSCYIDVDDTVVVQRVYEDVRCIGRLDDPSAFAFNNGNDTTVVFARPALADLIMLRLFSDADCSKTVRTLPFIFCQPINGSQTTTISSTATMGSTATDTIIIQDVVTVTVCPAPEPTTTATPTPTATPVCNLPAGPVCFVQDGRIRVRALPDDIGCLRRSDDLRLAFPTNGAVDYGLPPQDTAVSVTAFTDDVCNEAAFSLACINIDVSCPTPTATPTPTIIVTSTVITTTATATATII
eukprot:Unigene5439_Nuclearia_a/m.16653 Unigene5439_Nuclearia_a/g.16653  ORF Unigene5439_Nuclearia_a/g.16653 Unigene5439_Nuclearia_a/m.16653 type:complete len:343 (-) Unigene5439_Nuclearia_a:118-1146(-)